MPRMFRSEASERDGVTILRLHGRIEISGGGDVALREKFAELVEQGAQRIVVDMKDVEGADSSGVGEIVSLTTTAYNRQVILVFVAFSGSLRDIFEITQLISAVTYADSVETAIEAIRDASFEEFVVKWAYKKIEHVGASSSAATE